MDVKRMTELRYQLLKEVYEATGGFERGSVSGDVIEERMGLVYPIFRNIVNYLNQEGLINITLGIGRIMITHAGIVEYERTINSPTETTEHFPINIYNNITNIENSTGFQIQSGTNNSSQEQTIINQENWKILDILKQLTEEIVNKEAEMKKADATKLADIKEYIQSAIDEIKANNPKAKTIKLFLKEIHTIATGIFANILSQPIIQYLATLL